MADDFGTYIKGEQTRVATTQVHAVNLEASGWRLKSAKPRKAAAKTAEAPTSSDKHTAASGDGDKK